MSRPKKPIPELSATGILDRMTPGIVYNVPTVAEWFNVVTGTVRPMLLNLCAAGDIQKCRCPDNSFGYMRPKPHAELDTSVAGPARPPNLKSTMRGYDAQFRTRVELAMMARPR